MTSSSEKSGRKRRPDTEIASKIDTKTCQNLQVATADSSSANQKEMYTSCEYFRYDTRISHPVLGEVKPVQKNIDEHEPNSPSSCHHLDNAVSHRLFQSMDSFSRLQGYFVSSIDSLPHNVTPTYSSDLLLSDESRKFRTDSVFVSCHPYLSSCDLDIDVSLQSPDNVAGGDVVVQRR